MITKTAIALIAIGNIFYAYRCILGTRAFIDQYGMGDGSAFMIKLAGTFCAGLGFMLAYVLMIGIAGNLGAFYLRLRSGGSPNGCRLPDRERTLGRGCGRESYQGRVYGSGPIRCAERGGALHRRGNALRLTIGS